MATHDISIQSAAEQYAKQHNLIDASFSFHEREFRLLWNSYVHHAYTGKYHPNAGSRRIKKELGVGELKSY